MTFPKKKAALVCSTYRQDGRDNTARFMGAMSLVDQVLNQDFNGDLFLAVVDDSPKAHPFLEIMAQENPDKFVYLHVPERNNISPSLKRDFGEAVRLIPSDTDLANDPFWLNRIEQMKSWGKIVPFEDDFAARIDIRTHVFGSRPTIGTKKNVGVIAVCEKFGEPDYVLFADDDDYRGPHYASEISKALEKLDFTRIHKYLTYTSYGDHQETWGTYDYPFPQDANGYFYPTEKMREEPILTSQRDKNGDMIVIDPKKWFSRMAIAAWDPICNEGAIHNYRFDMWKKGFELFGGSAPSSMGEDIILYKELTDTFGRSVRRGLVPFTDYNFVRTADGNNASYVMYNRAEADGDVPSWATKYIDDLKAAHSYKGDVETDSRLIARNLVKTGEYKPRFVFDAL
ncbi:MAG: hypothetical protein DI551_09475 [Micavibrio aeruginosavorus]|uniref:Uncharacterized protein n=1 Tax=Micavibrio aeruginosavorus TaxID=349221 RepID=A0A2W5PJL1_9BACT|nr:MAG: hypothetical protein DI551_09475 [Micavibrio aeruginosavorus]